MPPQNLRRKRANIRTRTLDGFACTPPQQESRRQSIYMFAVSVSAAARAGSAFAVRAVCQAFAYFQLV